METRKSKKLSPCKKVKRPLNYDISTWKNTKSDTASDLENEDAQDPEFLMLSEQFALNYIIVKKILSYMNWQDRMVSSQVCKLWNDVARSFQNDNLSAYDFNIHQQPQVKTLHFCVSGQLQNEPLLILSFVNKRAARNEYLCKEFPDIPCTPCCNYKHKFLDVIYTKLCYPSDCLVGITCSKVIYMPLADTNTAHDTVTHYRHHFPFLSGLFLPRIPGVNVHILSVKAKIQQDYYDKVNKITDTEIVKGLLVFVSDDYLDDDSGEYTYLKYFKKRQPNIPYAMGGCIISYSILKNFHRTRNQEKIKITVIVLTVPKEPLMKDNNFEMYSLVVAEKSWDLPEIQSRIDEFATSIPKHKYSTAVKLSCVGRDAHHNVEQSAFRSRFPKTTLVGCYGNGELGLNHPSLETEAPKKRVKRDPDFVFSYSTIFVYMGWDK